MSCYPLCDHRCVSVSPTSCESRWLQVLSAAIVFSTQALPGPPCDLTYQNRRKKRRENLLATLIDSNLRDTEMAHIAREPLLQEATAMLSGKSPDKRQLCFLLARTETACIKVKALVWSESGSTEAAVGNSSELWVYWATADGDATVIFISFLTCQVSQNVIHKGY